LNKDSKNVLTAVISSLQVGLTAILSDRQTVISNVAKIRV